MTTDRTADLPDVSDVVWIDDKFQSTAHVGAVFFVASDASGVTQFQRGWKATVSRGYQTLGLTYTLSRDDAKRACVELFRAAQEVARHGE